MPAANPAVLSALRDRIDHIGGHSAPRRVVLPFGVPDIDTRIPKGGLDLGALHEIAGGANGAVGGPPPLLLPPGSRRALVGVFSGPVRGLICLPRRPPVQA